MNFRRGTLVHARDRRVGVEVREPVPAEVDQMRARKAEEDGCTCCPADDDNAASVRLGAGIM